MNDTVIPQGKVSSLGVSKPMMLDSLPDPILAHKKFPKRVQRQIDLMLLAIEALELGGAEVMLFIAKQLELDEIIPNRVAFWRMRCTNPWRRSYTRRHLKLAEAKALMVITSYRARQLTVHIRKLLLAQQQINEKESPLEENSPLAKYLDRFRVYFRSRMNFRRARVAAYNSDAEVDALALALLQQLLFCTGTSGLPRLWMSMFDGEVV
ncbi:MAG: DUF3038 domain-containing protein [Coleofasciculaceae cyanobacterium SM2_1_6]|nr:DUF3038 domain-containing protein [Coleofasciculaceae cyanobacterium SM2_1_6]